MASTDPGPGYQPGDVGVPATVSTFGTTFPVARASDIQGTHKNVNDLTARNAIADNKRDEGMTAWVISTNELYRLIGGITNGDWVLQGSSAAGTILVRDYAPGVLANDVVYKTAVANEVGRANSGALATGIPAGVVTALDSPLVGQCLVSISGDVAGFSGLVIGAQYILSTADGGIVLVSDTGNGNYPAYLTPGSGEVLAPVGVANAADTLNVNVGAAVVAVG